MITDGHYRLYISFTAWVHAIPDITITMTEKEIYIPVHAGGPLATTKYIIYKVQ